MPPPEKRLDDVERLGGLVDLHRDRLGALLEAQQRARPATRGCRRSAAPVASAEYSRWREIASWMSVAAIGARMTIASAPIRPSGESSSPPNHSSM